MTQPTKKFSLRQVNQNNKSSQGQSIPTGKRSLPGPTTPMNFLVMAIFKFAKLPLLIDLNYRIGFYLCIVSVGSVYFDLIRFPKSYFSNKYNFLNQVFAKWAWGWTFCVLFSFIVTSSYIYNGGSKNRMRRNILRLLIGTSCWYVITGVFHMIENETGECHIKQNGKFVIDTSIRNRKACKYAAGTWLGFDISGHVFLLTLCNLWICEEAKVLKHWYRLENYLLYNSTTKTQSSPDNSSSCSPNNPNKLTNDELCVAKKAFKSLNSNVKIITLVMSFLSLLFDLILICTIIYFHNMPSKLTALIFSLACWYLSYNVLFQYDSPILPTYPGRDIQNILLGCN